ncbi:hypothetical protein SK128_011246 [Halocaridina rubra]|uniref:Uncharacterized protein n=1 Tax=Halocaridina rubra TaxID=373956 RepID=A0AAN8XEY6_HALRR
MYQEENLKFDAEYVKALVLSANMPVHPHAEMLVSADWKIHAMFFSANTTSVIHRWTKLAGETALTLQDVQDWEKEKKSDLGYQSLLDEEIAMEVVGIQDYRSSSDE